ncbi:hypothetical protein N7491_010674 [Penicillium cf. griseofulvum]|uniref:Uncharacterized protein n=1 Tax=Penicillium cf. griseofulvum TaxID=2972120 RepID=A0A9W9T6A9_9EURO|nr:hypothetical protein N7472_001000 [Penicillium cf. griseofulvum]KAJ5422229.1 hypothetical protein N7491_010674 [Penicillium cf. griseofulvum]KAJ5428412.1 hypothetical protein N7445_009866 [Penicillium cf. griseofulvum]
MPYPRQLFGSAAPPDAKWRIADRVTNTSPTPPVISQNKRPTMCLIHTVPPWYREAGKCYAFLADVGAQNQ